jgi:hypothetical protein
MARYRKKPVVIDAVQVATAVYNGKTWNGSPFKCDVLPPMAGRRLYQWDYRGQTSSRQRMSLSSPAHSKRVDWEARQWHPPASDRG